MASDPEIVVYTGRDLVKIGGERVGGVYAVEGSAEDPGELLGLDPESTLYAAAKAA